MILGVISFTIYIPCFSVLTTLNVSFIIIAHHFLKSTLLFNSIQKRCLNYLQVNNYKMFSQFTNLNIINTKKGINCN